MSSDDRNVYESVDWPYGLRCMDCNKEFVEGQPIADRLVSMSELGDEPMFVLDIICVGCSVAEAMAE